MLMVALELLVVAAILYDIVKGVMPMAAALAGGISMAVMTARGLTDSLDKGRRGVQQTAKALTAWARVPTVLAKRA